MRQQVSKKLGVNGNNSAIRAYWTLARATARDNATLWNEVETALLVQEPFDTESANTDTNNVSVSDVEATIEPLTEPARGGEQIYPKGYPEITRFSIFDKWKNGTNLLLILNSS